MRTQVQSAWGLRRGLPLTVVAAALLMLAAPLAAQQTGSVTGRVLDRTTRQPIPFAQISIAGTRLGTVTQADGRFLLLQVPAGAHTVRVELIGYGAGEQTVTVTTGEPAVVNFELRPEAVSLDEVVVTGTAGAARRREIGNSVAALDVNRLKEVRPPVAVSDLLQAQVTGLQQFTTEGSPGSGTQIRIRGNNSITQGNTPLIYVDGIRLVNSDVGNLDQGSQQVTSTINMINPADIERIEVIRGAAATTLYGTEASSGVIQIFTKKGGSGRPTWAFNTTQGTSFLTDNTLGPTVGNVENWQGLKPFAQNGYIHKFDGSVRGSLGDVGYFLSGEYNYESGTFPTQDSRLAGFRANLNFRPIGWMNLTVNSAYSHRLTNWIQSGDNSYGVVLNLLRSPRNYVNGCGATDPLECDALVFDQRTQSIDDHFVSGLTASFNPIPSLSNRLTLGLDWRDGTNDWTIRAGHILEPEGQRDVNRWRHTTLTLDYVGSWATDVLPNLSSALSFGFQLFNDYDHREFGSTSRFSGPGVDQTLDSGTLRDNDESLLKVINAGFFAQEVVGIRDRLFLTGGVRVDGNSAFGEDYGLQAYPKLSASYVISEHDFWPDWNPVMKLRAAVGESGRAPGAFDAVRTWTPSAGNEDQPGVTPDNVGDPNLGPERTRELELGFEGSAFADRLSLDFTWYNATTYDALVPVQYPPSEGFSNPQLSNVGKIRNRGIELAVNVQPVRSENFQLETRVGLSTNESEALDLEGQQLQIGFQSWRQWAREGSPVPAYYDRKVGNPNEIADPVYVADQFYGSVYPKHNWNFSTSINFLKRFTLYGLAEQAGGHMMMAALARQNATRGLWAGCQVADTAATTALWRSQCLEHEWASWIVPADYFKLRTVSLTYQIPEKLIPGASTASLTVAGNNIWKKHDYPGLDPELTRGDTFLERREYYHVPAPQQWTATLRVVF